MFIQNILAKLADSEADTPQLFSAVYTKRYIMKKVASRCPLDASPKEQGRSMVEMLGVLAIIGVLSVGAISGYSKAMMKYKLNKQTEQIGSILDYVNIHLDDFKRSKTTISTNMIPILKKLNVIPQEMTRENTSSKIYDIFGTMIALSNYFDGNYIFEFRLFINKGQKESCMNLFTIAKAKREQLWRTKFETTKGEESSSANIVKAIIIAHLTVNALKI